MQAKTDRYRRTITKLSHNDAKPEQHIILLRLQLPAWGARKPEQSITEPGLTMPAVSSFHTILNTTVLSSLILLHLGPLHANFNILTLIACDGWILKGTFRAGVDVSYAQHVGPSFNISL